MEFRERLFSLLIQNKMSISDLSRSTGISTARISNFCNGKDMPSLINSLILANYFNCSFNYLFCLSEENKNIRNKREFLVDVFLSRLEKVLHKNKLSQRQLCKEVGINKSCISNWRYGQNPKPRNLIKMAKRLDCSIDYLIGFED